MANEPRASSCHPRSSPGFSFAGLAIVLSDGNADEHHARKGGILCSTEDSGERRELERALGRIFDVPGTSLSLPCSSRSVDSSVVAATLEERMDKFFTEDGGDRSSARVCVMENGSRNRAGLVSLDEASACGDVRIVDAEKGFSQVESHGVFSSVRANACVNEGKWMYEVTLETAGIQQLGWATLTCPFTRNEGVGDDLDSYAFDGKRVRKWNKHFHVYGQQWVAGDVIACCIDLRAQEISFYRNGLSLGVAFYGVRKPVPGYFPAVSLSQGERSIVNFGSRPFCYPVEGFLPLQLHPTVKRGKLVASVLDLAAYLLQSLSRLVKFCFGDVGTSTSVERLMMFRRGTWVADLFHPAGQEICRKLFGLLEGDVAVKDFVVWGALVPFLLDIFGSSFPHNSAGLDKVLDLFWSFPQFKELILPLLDALAYNCKTSTVSLVQCPYTGSYPHLALACHILRRKDILLHCWTSPNFDSTMEGFLSRKGPNKQDLQELIPVVWWPGCREDLSSENNMKHTISALARAIDKVEDMQFELCRILVNFIPSSKPSEPQGAVFRTFVQRLIWKNRGVGRNILPPGLSDNSVLVSAFTVLLRFLSEGFGMDDSVGFMKCSTQKVDNAIGFLHRGGRQCFPVALFLKEDSHHIEFSRLGGTFSHLLKAHAVTNEEMEEIHWDEGCMDDGDNKVTHSSRQKPCCCSYAASSDSCHGKDIVKTANKCSSSHGSSIADRATVNVECSPRRYNNEIQNKGTTSDQSSAEILYEPVQRCAEPGLRLTQVLNAALREEELFDTMLLLYHLGLAPNFKQASYYMSHQSHYIALLDDTEKQIRAENISSELLRRLKEARNVHREDVVDCVRQCGWYKVTLLARWKQRGMYAMCMWISQLLLMLSKKDNIFPYVPEFYVETLVDCFHALRRSDPPFVSPTALLVQGLSSFVTFLVTHFNDSRIANADLRDALLQSIAVLVQYKEFIVAFETNNIAAQRMPGALIQAFDNRFWIPITNILLRLCKGSGFCTSKYSETCSRRFQGLLRDKCILDEKLFACFINRLFNTLSWTVTEFSISLKEMQEHHHVPDLQQRKCVIIFELSCNLARLLEFFTCEVPQAFLCGPGMNMMRLAELIVFVLSHTTATADAELFDNVTRQQGQSLEKVNRAMMLAPVVGMILNLSKADIMAPLKVQNTLLQAFVDMNCPTTIEFNLQYLWDFNWAGVFKGDTSLVRLMELKHFIEKLKVLFKSDAVVLSSDTENEEICCICYAAKIDTIFVPCSHQSCLQCISRHLLNNQRCFFCNAVVTEVCSMSCVLATEDDSYRAPGGTNTLVAGGGILIKPDAA